MIASMLLSLALTKPFAAILVAKNMAALALSVGGIVTSSEPTSEKRPIHFVVRVNGRAAAKLVLVSPSWYSSFTPPLTKLDAEGKATLDLDVSTGAVIGVARDLGPILGFARRTTSEFTKDGTWEIDIAACDLVIEFPEGVYLPRGGSVNVSLNYGTAPLPDAYLRFGREQPAAYMPTPGVMFVSRRVKLGFIRPGDVTLGIDGALGGWTKRAKLPATEFTVALTLAEMKIVAP